MKQGIDTLSNYQQWRKLYNELAASDKSPFFTPQYYQAYLEVENHPVRCFWAYQDEDNYLFYPFLIRSINALGYELDDEHYDICGAYGYNGPLGKVKDPNFITLFNNELQSYLRESKVVTEFVRYCPVIGNREFHSYTEHIHVLDNVYVDLSQGLDHVWEKEFSGRVRTSIRKGESYSLETIIERGNSVSEEHLSLFYAIYNSTMQRNLADDFYYFDLNFFTRLLEEGGSSVVLALTFLGNTTISTGLFLVEGANAFQFLGGTLSDFYKYQANSILQWEIIKYLYSYRVKKYSLGGGSSKGDSLFTYKKSFARYCDNPFYIGTKIHNPGVYSEIVDQWQQKYPGAAAKHTGKVQGYRIFT